MIALKAHFDGKVFVPDEPVGLAPNQRVRITVEADVPAQPGEQSGDLKATGKRTFGTQKGVVLYVAPDFDAYLGDEFWGLTDGKDAGDRNTDNAKDKK